MDECLDSLGEAQYFTTLDANNGYWQIPVAEEDRDKTTFTCHAGTYRFLRMPFGLCNAPATFQRAMDILLAGIRWKSCLVYLDDIIIFSKEVDEHIKHVEQVLEKLQSARVSLKLKKCKFFAKTVDYLGHVIGPGLLEVANRIPLLSMVSRSHRRRHTSGHFSECAMCIGDLCPTSHKSPIP